MRREGLDSLSEDELEEANKERGLVSNLSDEQLKNQLKVWLNLTESKPEAVLPLWIYHYGYSEGKLSLKL